MEPRPAATPPRPCRFAYGTTISRPLAAYREIAPIAPSVSLLGHMRVRFCHNACNVSYRGLQITHGRSRRCVAGPGWLIAGDPRRPSDFAEIRSRRFPPSARRIRHRVEAVPNWRRPGTATESAGADDVDDHADKAGFDAPVRRSEAWKRDSWPLCCDQRTAVVTRLGIRTP